MSKCGGIHVEDVIPVPDAAAMIGTTRWTLNRRIASGELDVVECGSVRLVRRADVAKLNVRNRISNPLLDGSRADSSAA